MSARLTPIEKITLKSIAGKIPRIVSASEAYSLCSKGFARPTSAGGFELTPKGIRALQEQDALTGKDER